MKKIRQKYKKRLFKAVFYLAKKIIKKGALTNEFSTLIIKSANKIIFL